MPNKNNCIEKSSYRNKEGSFGPILPLDSCGNKEIKKMFKELSPELLPVYARQQ